MAGLPKKYAKMGFKRGWAAYKRSKRSRSPARRTTKNKVVRTARKRSYRRTYRRARTAGGSMKPIIDGLIPDCF